MPDILNLTNAIHTEFAVNFIYKVLKLFPSSYRARLYWGPWIDVLLNVIGTNPWYTYLETPTGIDQLWAAIPPQFKSQYQDQYELLRSTIVTWNQGETKKPNLRASYSTEISDALAIKEFYRQSLLQGSVYFDYEMSGKNIYQILRKQGPFGGLFDIGDATYIRQPSILNMYFKIGSTPVWEEIEVPNAGLIIDLPYDLFKYGRSRVQIRGKGKDGIPPDMWLNEQAFIVNTPARHIGDVSFDALSATNNGRREASFRIETWSTSNQRYWTMMDSDYRGTQSSWFTPYSQWFNWGHPTRRIDQDPIADPLHYWPYVLRMVPLKKPTGLHYQEMFATYQVKLIWTDHSELEDGFKIGRRRDDQQWNSITENYASVGSSPGSGGTKEFIDAVSFCRRYVYKIRAYDNANRTSEWCDSIIYVCGSLVESGERKLSAFNNGVKAVTYGNNVYSVCAVGDWGDRELFCLRSSDGGNSFVSELLPIQGYDANGCHSNPAIAMTSTGIPYVVWGSLYWTDAKGTAGWFRSYFCSYRMNNQWYTYDLYAHKMNEISGWYPIEDSLSPPAFVITTGFPSDSGFVLFKNKNDASNMQLVSFVLSTPTTANYSSVPGSNNSAQFPSIGIDRGDVNNISDDRLLVIGYDYIPGNCSGSLKLYHRAIGPSGSWQSITIPNCTAYGTPALWVSNNAARITFEGDDGEDFGLIFLPFDRSGTTYVPQNSEVITENVDCSPDGIDGYSYLASRDIVLWRYLDDIYYARRIGTNSWQILGNLSSTTSNISSYPQGFVTGGVARPKLFALWTEKVGTSYYLVRKIIILPSANQNITQIAETEIPEATAYNNAHRMLKDNQDKLHLVYTNDNNVYHIFHNTNDTIWSEPALLGEGKYPALALGADGKLYCTWCYHGYQEFNGMPYYVEYLRMRSYNGVSWSKPTKLLFHTYGTYLWGVGAPSLAVKDTFAYVTFKSYHGPTFNPTPGEPYPHIVVVEGPALIYGSFPLNNPDAYAYQIIDTIIKTPNPVDTLTYRDSLVPLLISPSITVDLAGIPHILWEGDSLAMRYYTITDSAISRQLFDVNTSNKVDFPSLACNGDQVQLLWTASDSIRYRYGWTNTENLSQPITIAACENPIASGPYLAWTKNDSYLSHFYYGAIPANGLIEPFEINYSTDRISYPQILFNPEKQNQTPSLDLVWTEYSQTDSLGYIYYLNLPLAEEVPVYSFDMGTETPVPVLVQRDGFLAYGFENFKTIDYDSLELIYHLTLHSPHKKYKIKWTYYHQEPDKLKLDFSIDDILHHNRWVNPYEQVTQETWIPDSCLADNEIFIRVKKLSGTLAVLSGFEIYEQIVGGGGPQGSEVMISQPFSMDQIYPNPAKGMIKIRFNSPTERLVSIKLYDVTGRLVEKLFNERAHTGANEVLITAGELANGIYFLKLETEGYCKVAKVILLK